MLKLLKIVFVFVVVSFGVVLAADYNASSRCAKKIYQELNKKSANPFVVSIGTALSHTHYSSNTVHPEYLRKILQQCAQKENNPKKWLKHKDRIGYVQTALPIVACTNCYVRIDPSKLSLVKDQRVMESLIDEAVNNTASNKLTLKKCVHCSGALVEQPRKQKIFTEFFLQNMLDQLTYLGVNEQLPCLRYGLPNYRLSLDVTDVLKDGSTKIDPVKLQQQANLVAQFGNPLLFLHHYENPQTIENLFQKSEHVDWFANYCAQMIAAVPQITHVCPISQPIAFVFRTIRQSLPPFTSTVSQPYFMENITQAQVVASKKMKQINPKLKVLISHQWKLFKPKHGFGDPRRALELMVCKIAHRMYNGAFVKMLQPHQDHFDGIALSVYPAIHFNLWEPESDNAVSRIDADNAFETIMETHKAFPSKDIFIVETGCNTTDPKMKKDFIDMTLAVCQKARQNGVKIKGVYFWEQSNDTQDWYQWNHVPLPTQFAPFDGNTVTSINAAGLYIKEIVEAVF